MRGPSEVALVCTKLPCVERVVRLPRGAGFLRPRVLEWAVAPAGCGLTEGDPGWGRPVGSLGNWAVCILIA